MRVLVGNCFEAVVGQLEPAHCVLDGPIQATCPNSMVHERAMQASGCMQLLQAALDQLDVKASMGLDSTTCTKSELVASTWRW